MQYAIYEKTIRTNDSWNNEPWEEAPRHALLMKGADRTALIAKANAHFSMSSTIHSYRGVEHKLSEITGRSEERRTEGGGCAVFRMFYLVKLRQASDKLTKESK